jgi:hypothetical protein
MSGLLALLDDVAALAKVAAASVDDVASQAAKTTAKVAGGVVDDAAKAGSKAAGAVIDDAAVTPKYTTGFPAAREVPIVWRIARGSIRNKLLILLPAALAMNAFAPWAIAPLLMLGGGYLCLEGAEKVLHALRPEEVTTAEQVETLEAAHLEEKRVAGAIKTDFILSAEIMTIALAAIPRSTFWLEAVTLAVVAIAITVIVYGAVVLIVKADDAGVLLAARGRLAATRALGRGIVRAMPRFLKGLTAVGTVAMLWVGGSIIVHALEEMGLAGPAHAIHGLAAAIAHVASEGARAGVEWTVTAVVDGLLGLLVGLGLALVAERVLGLFGMAQAAKH